MPANVSAEYTAVERTYLAATSDEEKLVALQEMIKYMPKHKSAESLRKNIRTRYKKLKEKIEKKKKSRGRKEGIRKEGTQVVLIGFTNSGKSSLLSSLTHATPKIASYEFTTKLSIVGTLDYEGVRFQIIDLPAINYETFDQGLANTADILLLVTTSISDLEEILPFLEKSTGKKIIVFNKSDFLSEKDKRKLSETLKSKRYDFCIISCKTGEGIEDLKNKLLENSDVIRIYTKQPHKPVDKEPVTMKPPVTVQDVAEKILKKGIKIKEVRVTGPSSKFPKQKVGLSHKLKDKDVVEFHTL